MLSSRTGLPQRSSDRRWSVRAGVAILGLLASTGCQVEYAGMTLPSGKYMHDDVQYFAPGPEFAYANTQAATQRARMQAQGIPTPPPPGLNGPGGTGWERTGRDERRSGSWWHGHPPPDRRPRSRKRDARRCQRPQPRRAGSRPGHRSRVVRCPPGSKPVDRRSAPPISRRNPDPDHGPGLPSLGRRSAAGRRQLSDAAGDHPSRRSGASALAILPC